MTGLTTRTFDAYNAALAICETVLPGYVTVYDGPQPGVPVNNEMMMFGCQDVGATTPTVSIENGTQDWHSLGPVSKEERFTIWAVYVAWDGNTNNLSGCRARTATNLELIGTYLRTTTDGLTLSNALGPTGWCSLAVDRITQISNRSGTGIQTQFGINCTAFI